MAASAKIPKQGGVSVKAKKGGASVTIRKQGGAAIMTIPTALLKAMQLEIGAVVSLSVNNRTLVAQPALPARKRYTLTELLKGSEKMKKLNADVAWSREGNPVGREIA